MQTGHDPNQMRCVRCQAPLGHSIGRCPFCGTEIGAPDTAKPFEPAVVGMSEQHRDRLARARKAKRNSAAMGAAVFAAAALLLIAVGGTAAFFLLREPADTDTVPSAATTIAPVPERPPLNVNGIVLKDGPEVDPTDVIHLVRGRLLDMHPGTEVKLLGIEVHRAQLGKVNLDDTEAYVTYRYLIIKRDPRAAKANEKSATRVEFMLRADAPDVKSSEAPPDSRTVEEPLCVWSAAWRSAIASGLSEKDHLEVSYGLDEKGKDAVWSFSVRDRPDTQRAIDGQSCAIKVSKVAPAD